MKNKSELEKHIGKFSIVDEVSEDLFIPAQWRNLAGLSNREKIKFIINLWKVDFQVEFSALLEAFRKHLISIELIEINKFVNILYIFQNPKEDYLHYIGHPPLLHYQRPKAVKKFSFPAKFLDFYIQIHNG